MINANGRQSELLGLVGAQQPRAQSIDDVFAEASFSFGPAVTGSPLANFSMVDRANATRSLRATNTELC